MVSAHEPPQDGEDARATVAGERTAFGSNLHKQSIILLPLCKFAGLVLVARWLWAAAFCLSAAAL
jgi:hypothetical protein